MAWSMGVSWLCALVKGGGKGKGSRTAMGQLQDSLVVSACRSWKPRRSWTQASTAGASGPHTPRASPAPGTPQPCPRPSAAPWAEGLREVPVAQPAPEGPAPGGVCGVDTSGAASTRRAWSTHPLHPPGALSLQHGSVHQGSRPPPGSVPCPSKPPLPNAPTSPAALNAASGAAPFTCRGVGQL